MINKAALQQYSTVQISTVDRGRLLVMLYDGCINFLKLAKEGLENKDIPKFARFLSKSQAIISELMLTLDFEKGGEIAKDLDRIYDFALFYLTEANLEKNPEKITKVIGIISTIAEAYRDIVEVNPRVRIEGNEVVTIAAAEEGAVPRESAGLRVAM
jgi:flagellar protein FliS